MGVRVGETVQGKFLVESLLHEGRTWSTYSARNVVLETRVVLKVLREAVRKDHVALGRFINEARALARVHSEHVVHVLDVGETADGSLLLVMEYLEGEGLDQVAARTQPIASSDLVSWMLQACEALDVCHRSGVVHRNLTPANLLVVKKASGGTSVKVVDFGLARILSDGPSLLTGQGERVGTPQYMSPEQIQGLPTLDERSDLWSLGVILYELASGRLPFQGERLDALARAIVTGVYPPLSSFRPDLPRPIHRVVETCLRVDPADRYPTVRHLVQDLGLLAPDQVAMLFPFSLHPAGDQFRTSYPSDLSLPQPSASVPDSGRERSVNPLDPTLDEQTRRDRHPNFIRRSLAPRNQTLLVGILALALSALGVVAIHLSKREASRRAQAQPTSVGTDGGVR